MYNLVERDLLGDIEYKIILGMFSLLCNYLNCKNCCCFFYSRMGLIYLNTSYLHRELVLSTEAAMFCVFTVVQTGQTKSFAFL